jgi:hypothetical protein
VKARFRDAGEWLHQFSDLFLVRCPRCDKCAAIVVREPGSRSYLGKEMGLLFEPRRMVCSHCGYAKDWDGQMVGPVGVDATDFYFHFPLWLQISCCGQTLWALNPRHLGYMRGYVSAGLRERLKPGSMASKLPRWLMSAKNRREIVRCIDKLANLVPDAYREYSNNSVKEGTNT